MDEFDADGWLPTADPKAESTSLIEGLLEPIENVTTLTRIRLLDSTGGQGPNFVGVSDKTGDLQLVPGDRAVECGLFGIERPSACTFDVHLPAYLPSSACASCASVHVFICSCVLHTFGRTSDT